MACATPVRALQMAPRLSGGVAHAMAVSVSVGRLKRLYWTRNRRESGTCSRTERSADLPDNPVPLLREILVTKSRRFRARSHDRSGVRGEHDRCTLPATHQSKELHLVGCDDHHACDAGSVLGIVQGSSLRSARACARPAGLDDACAQIGLGNYAMVGGVMTGSWTDLAR